MYGQLVKDLVVVECAGVYVLDCRGDGYEASRGVYCWSGRSGGGVR